MLTSPSPAVMISSVCGPLVRFCTRGWHSGSACSERKLTAAAEEFARESAALNAAGGLFPGWGLPHEADAALNARVAARLAEARDAYARGIDAIDRALAVLGPPPTIPYSADWPVRL